ncbi:hypothetical protein M0G43_12085 [Subsaxibacter sp. CAU 1640]|uniref:BfmA/BtgA family mobilization protein n=1 Tax=Subsaxibacter sp. CAU 1640 TaxID=2933271 RepID=UPI0020055CCA|nr:BfmA/BtgA family mobilization protein [Subsaxibacter sp. CAU 1640]MCK7591317.1 hypothetical protein [Subsaxibacter sp. CAU 1640]
MFRLLILNKLLYISRLQFIPFRFYHDCELFFTKKGHQPNKTGNYFTKNMDEGFEKERFETLKIKASIVVKFRRFCKTMSKSQSMTLLLMIDFFETNGISPNESMGPHIHTLEKLFKKRINGVIAIMKNIEKYQTKPTVAMLQSLFEEAEPIKKPRMLEKSPEEFKAQFENKKTDL